MYASQSPPRGSGGGRVEKGAVCASRAEGGVGERLGCARIFRTCPFGVPSHSLPSTNAPPTRCPQLQTRASIGRGRWRRRRTGRGGRGSRTLPSRQPCALIRATCRPPLPRASRSDAASSRTSSMVCTSPSRAHRRRSSSQRDRRRPAARKGPHSPPGFCRPRGTH